MTAEATSTAGLFFVMPRTDSTIANKIAGQPNTTAGHQFTLSITLPRRRWLLSNGQSCRSFQFQYPSVVLNFYLKGTATSSQLSLIIAARVSSLLHYSAQERLSFLSTTGPGCPESQQPREIRQQRHSLEFRR